MADAAMDRGVFWRSAPERETARLDREGWSARCVNGLGQTMLSGDVAAAVAATAPGVAEVGLWAIVPQTRFAIRIARDQALLVTPAPLRVAEGWRDGYAVAPCDDGYAVIEIAGEESAAVVAEAVSAELEAGSRSAATLFAGVAALLYRTGPQTVRVHVEAPLAAYLWTWLAER